MSAMGSLWTMGSFMRAMGSWSSAAGSLAKLP